MTSNASCKRFAPIQTWLPPWSLSSCVRAVLWRSTVGMGLGESQRWGHYPASPVCAISCLFEGSADIQEASAEFDPQAFRCPVPEIAATGPHSLPRSVWYGPQVDGVMVLFYPDAWWALTGVEPQSLNNQMVEAQSVLPPALLAACQRMRQGGHAHERVQTFFDDLLPLWNGLGKNRFMHPGPWAQALNPWLQSLALRAAATGWGRSVRQSERRIKQWTGWSLRKLHGAVRGEAAFFAVMEAMLEKRVDWTQIALDSGFSDQSHFIRETRRITGFSPEALRHGFNCEEAFWVYRAWAHLAGYEMPVPTPVDDLALAQAHTLAQFQQAREPESSR